MVRMGCGREGGGTNVHVTPTTTELHKSCCVFKTRAHTRIVSTRQTCVTYAAYLAQPAIAIAQFTYTLLHDKAQSRDPDQQLAIEHNVLQVK